MHWLLLFLLTAQLRRAASLSITSGNKDNKPESANSERKDTIQRTGQERTLSSETTLPTIQQLGQDIDGAVPGDSLGYAVAISANGKRIVVGAPRSDGGHDVFSGQVTVYEWNGENWDQLGPAINAEAPNDWFGKYVAMTPDGNRIAVGAPFNDSGNRVDKGHVRVFDWNNEEWVQVGQDIDGKQNAEQSGPVAISSNGKRLIVLAPYYDGVAGVNTGSARVYELQGDTWTQLGKDIEGVAPQEPYAQSVAMNAAGSRIAIGNAYNDGVIFNGGQARVFDWVGSSWEQVGDDIYGQESNDLAGSSITMSASGNRIAIGLPGHGEAGTVRVFDFIGNVWTQVGGDIDGEAVFGHRSGEEGNLAMSADGSRIVIGDEFNREFSVSAGHVRVFDLIEGAWTQVGPDIDGEANADSSGIVALSANGKRLVIGAPDNDGNGFNSGHVRVYEIITDKDGGGGGDPHFFLWNKERETFHGECDLVMVHSDSFHGHAGFDLHARTTMESFYSFIESAAFRVGRNTIEIERDRMFLDGVQCTVEDLPLKFGSQKEYSIVMSKNDDDHREFRVQLRDAKIIFHFARHFLHIKVRGAPTDFADAVGLLGDYSTGAMLGRDGNPRSVFQDFAFEWQVAPEDPKLFREQRAPQLPHEKCRMPSPSTSRKMLRNNGELMDQAKVACASAGHVRKHFDLCVQDIVATGYFGLADAW